MVEHGSPTRHGITYILIRNAEAIELGSGGSSQATARRDSGLWSRVLSLEVNCPRCLAGMCSEVACTHAAPQVDFVCIKLFLTVGHNDSRWLNDRGVGGYRKLPIATYGSLYSPSTEKKRKPIMV